MKKHFGAIWPVHLSAFSRLLRQLRTAFDGDLDLLLILATIAERTPSGNWEREVESFRSILRPTNAPRRQQPINIQSVSDYTGVPRETVRRKVTLMEVKGWVLRHDDGQLSVTRTAAADLERATGHSIAYIAEVMAAYDRARTETGDGER